MGKYAFWTKQSSIRLMILSNALNGQIDFRFVHMFKKM